MNCYFFVVFLEVNRGIVLKKFWAEYVGWTPLPPYSYAADRDDMNIRVVWDDSGPFEITFFEF